MKGGVVGGAAMAVVALAYGVVVQRSLWYPVNLLAAVAMPGMAQADTAQLRAFDLTALIIGIVAHGVISILAGLLYAVILPMLARRHMLWGGLVAPLLWTGGLWTVLGIVNPVLNARVDWTWFVVSQIVYGLAAGYVVWRAEPIPTMQTWPLTARGIGCQARPPGALAVRRRVRVLAAAVAGLTGLVLAACDALPGRPDAAKREVVPTEVTAFDALYGRNCAGCHGAEGRLGAARPLNDPVYLALVPADRLRAIIRGGVPSTSMPAFGTAAGGELTDAQVEALAQGLLARWGRPDVVKGVTLPPYGMPPDASGTAGRERGATVYAHACARCHGSDGRGGPKGGPIVDPTHLRLVSDQSLRSTVIAGRPTWATGPARRPARHPLTPEEITDVVSWLAAHRQPVPGRPAPSGGPRGPRP